MRPIPLCLTCVKHKALYVMKRYNNTEPNLLMYYISHATPAPPPPPPPLRPDITEMVDWV